MEFESMTLQEKIDTRENLIRQMRELNETTVNGGETRDFTAEEKSRYEGMRADVKKLFDLISKEKRSNEIAGFAEQIPAPGRDDEERASGEMEEFRSYLLTEHMENRAHPGAMVVDGSDQTAGALAPQEFVKKILADVQKEVKVLNRVNVIHLNQASSIGVPRESADAADAEWTTEIPVSPATAIAKSDKTWAFGKRELGANQLAKLVLVSTKLLKTSAFPVDQLVREKVTLKIRQAMENAVVKGTGSGQPLGVFTASADGVPTSRDVTTKKASAIEADDIIAAKRAVKQAYRRNGVWVIHPDILTDVITLKDLNGQYLWRSGLTDNDPDRLYGSEVIESDFAPAEKTGGAYAAVYGDFSNYWLTMVDQISVQVLRELYAPSGQVGYLATAFADGAPVLAEAFSRLKYKAS